MIKALELKWAHCLNKVNLITFSHDLSLSLIHSRSEVARTHSLFSLSVRRPLFGVSSTVIIWYSLYWGVSWHKKIIGDILFRIVKILPKSRTSCDRHFFKHLKLRVQYKKKVYAQPNVNFELHLTMAVQPFFP